MLSILIPTRNRPELAAGCVRAILAGSEPAARDAASGAAGSAYEILVLDQSDSEATRLEVEKAAGSRPGLPGAPERDERLRWVEVEGVGRSRALNAGVPLARGSWIVIVDDDCEPAPGWLESLEREIVRARPLEVIVGRVLPGPAGLGMAVPPATLEDPEPAEYEGRIDRDLVYPNFAVPRQAFQELGTFDERMGVGTPLPGGEDNDFGYRLLRAGWRILYRPGPTVVHKAWRTREARAALKRSYGIGQGAFYAKHLAAADAFIAYRFAHDVLRAGRAAAGAALRGWWDECRGHLAFLSGLFVGAAKMTLLMIRGKGTPPP